MVVCGECKCVSYDIVFELCEKLKVFGLLKGISIKVVEVLFGLFVLLMLFVEVYGFDVIIWCVVVIELKKIFVEVLFIVDIDDFIGEKWL